MAETPIVTIALCGFGRAGNMHFTTIRQSYRCKLKYVVDVTSRLEEVRIALRKWNMVDVIVVPSESYKNTVLEDEDIQAVIVTTPTWTHEQYVCDALKAGKAVFCEKPIAETIPATKNCYDLAEKVGKPLFCAFNRRFDPAFCNAREKIVKGEIGKVHTIRTISRDSPLPSIEYLKHSGGMFHDSSVHDIDVICWYLGEAPVEVYAQTHTNDPEIKAVNDVDTIAIVMKFPSGIIATVDQSRHSSYGYDQRLEVFGEKGTISVENVHKVPVTTATNDGINHSQYVYSFPTRYAEAYRNELYHFFDVVVDPSVTLRVTQHDILLAVRIADVCIKSQVSKKAESLDAAP